MRGLFSLHCPRSRTIVRADSTAPALPRASFVDRSFAARWHLTAFLTRPRATLLTPGT
jgi:hypothetical protein